VCDDLGQAGRFAFVVTVEDRDGGAGGPVPPRVACFLESHADPFVRKELEDRQEVVTSVHSRRTLSLHQRIAQRPQLLIDRKSSQVLPQRLRQNTGFPGSEVKGSKLLAEQSADLRKSHVRASLVGVVLGFLGLVASSDEDGFVFGIDVVGGAVLNCHLVDLVPEFWEHLVRLVKVRGYRVAQLFARPFTLLSQYYGGVIVLRILMRPGIDGDYLPPGRLSNGDLPCIVWARFCRFRTTTTGALLRSAASFLRFAPTILEGSC
jgi:hypothetical protein